MVDAMSKGRLHTTVGTGLPEVEYRALGVDFGRRGELMDQALAAMIEAWSDESGCCRAPDQAAPAAVRRRRVRATAPGGAVPASAEPARPPPRPRRVLHRPLPGADLQPFVLMPPAVNRGMIYLHEDPERAGPNSASTSSGRRSPTVGG